MKFPGRNLRDPEPPGVSRVTRGGVSGHTAVLPPGTDNPSDRTARQQSRRRTWVRRRLCVETYRSADLGDQFPDDLAHAGGHLGVLARVLPVERFERHRQLEILDDPRAGEAERLAGLVVRPDAAVLTE
ncbi:MAG: hypothetical protein QOC69_623 [Mycobacterium sp.]|nr:hypothetical protein [Mycobacterium sp.]